MKKLESSLKNMVIVLTAITVIATGLLADPALLCLPPMDLKEGLLCELNIGQDNLYVISEDFFTGSYDSIISCIIIPMILH